MSSAGKRVQDFEELWSSVDQSRRGFLLRLTVCGLVGRASRLLPSTFGGIAAAYSSRAHAEPISIATCLAVASAVAGLIASQNRSDGGVGALLSATLDYQRVMSQQLGTLQEAIAQVLRKLAELPQELRQVMREDRLARLHSKLGVQVIRYQVVASKANTFQGGFKAWQSSPLTRDSLRDISNLLDQATAEVFRGRWIDPLTTLYLPAAAFTTLGVRSAMGEEAEQLKIEAQRYVDLLSQVADPEESGSVAAELRERTRNYERLVKEVSWEGYDVPKSNDDRPQAKRFGEVTVKDFVPRTLVREAYVFFDKNGNVVPSRHFAATAKDVSEYRPERNGPTETFEFIADVQPFYVKEGKGVTATSIRQYKVNSSLKVAVTSGPSVTLPDLRTAPRPGGKGAPQILRFEPRPVREDAFTADAPTTSAREAAARRSPSFKTADEQRKQLEAKLTLLNVEIAQIALCLSALAAAASTRRRLFRFFGQEV